MYYREFIDLAYAMPKQREGGVTLSLASNGSEVDWIARAVLQMSTNDALKFMNDEYVEIRDRYPGEFELMANAHATLIWRRPSSGANVMNTGDQITPKTASTAIASSVPSPITTSSMMAVKKFLRLGVR
jgi:hypothetical protein